MQSTLKIWETSRKIYLKILDNYSLEQLNKIPEGYSNNLIWNAGHVIVTQQKLIYALSNLPITIPVEMVEKYQKGSRPDGKTTQAEVDEIRELLLSTVEKTKGDLDNAVFETFNEYQTKTGFHLGTFEDAIQFNNYHEGIHLGLMLTIRKFV